MEIDFEEFRALVAKEVQEETEGAIKEYLKAIGFTETVAYERDTGDRILTIYTNHPGVIIGKRGEGHSALARIVSNRMGFGWKVVIKEIRGNFVTIEKE